MNPQLSIIIATYNSEKTLRYALNSVQKSHFQNWECIIVDGVSSDSTIDIVKEFKKNDVRFRYVSEPDKGIYDAFNKGWKIAKGEWIYYLGSDDTLLADGIFEIFNRTTIQSDIIYGNILVKFPDKSSLLVKPYHPQKLKYHMFCNHQGIIMKRELIIHMDGFNLDYKMASDYDLLQRCYLKGYKFEYVNKTIALFSYSGVSSKFDYRQDLDIYYCNKKNNSNPFPFFFFFLYEIRRLLGFIDKKFIKRRL